MATFQLEVQPDMLLRVYGCGGDVKVTGHDRTTIEVNGDDDGEEALERYLRQDGNTITINGYPSDLNIALPHRASVELNGIGGDVEVRAVGDLGAQAMAKLAAHGIGGDVRVSDVAQIDLESIGGDATIEHKSDAADANQRVVVGRVGGDFTIQRAAQLSLHVAGGDANLGEVERLESLGHIGGDLHLTLTGGLEGNIRTIVGGDAKIDLSEAPNLTLVATVGGDFKGSGEEWNLRRGAGRHSLVFGEGGPPLQLMIGGDLRLHSKSAPQQTTGFAGHHGEGTDDWHDFRGTMEGFGEDMRGFGRELEEIGRNLAHELSSLGRDIAREVRIAGRETMRDAARNRVGRMGGFGRGQGQHGDFGFDSEQVERLKREARAAAASGIARAQEAVEQALQQWQQGKGPGGRPVPPARGPVPPRPPQPPFTGQTVRIDREAQEPEPQAPEASASQPANRDAERLAILRMVHEGRLAPDEAEMLLRGLDSRS
ncbi:MAG TPA: hypothetical protein VGD69_01715 [Herpetosiphonaceae bacterium]